MLLGRNKSGQFSETFGTSHRSSDQALNIWKSWKMVNMQLWGSTRQWGSDPGTIPQCVAPAAHGLVVVLTHTPMHSGWKIPPQNSYEAPHGCSPASLYTGDGNGQHVCGESSFTQLWQMHCACECILLSHHQLHVGVQLIRVSHIYTPGRINQLEERSSVFNRDGLSSRGILRAGP